MIRTKTKSQYEKGISVYDYYIRREVVEKSKLDSLVTNPEVVAIFDGSYASIRRAIVKMRDKKSVGKKFFEKQMAFLEVYEKNFVK
jgi:hypothetical protein